MIQSQVEEEFVICPFNSSHHIVAHRMHKHLLKCKKNYKGPPLKMCIYNAVHWVPEDEMCEHLKECQDYHMFNHSLYLHEAKTQKSS